MGQILDDRALDVIFRNARTLTRWQARPVDDEAIRAIYALMRYGPTSANGCPARIAFVRSRAAKGRLRPALSAGNVAKTMTAPVTAVIGWDARFYERLDKLFPHEPQARSWFEGRDATIRETGLRDGSLQAAYLIVAARSLGLDCGPMAGFDRAKVDAEFFAGGRVRSFMLCNLGYGDRTDLPPRHPRLDFDEACQIL